MKILLLGSTGSIGTSVCNCVRRFTDRFSIVGLAAHNNIDKLLHQIDEFHPISVSVGNPDAARAMRGRKNITTPCAVYEGNSGLLSLVNELDYDILVNALVGAVGFLPTVAALNRNKKVALANKESLVIGGDYINSLLAQGKGSLVPIDSEHSAILQCLGGENHDAIESIILTASGGPFRELPADAFKDITPQQALNHPTWVMGNKITIDAATLMNKGFEVIEAHYLFGLPYDKLRVCIHPQSILHSMVEFHDGAMVAQMGVPDMELPIQFALTYPERLPLMSKRLCLPAIGALTFFEPDFERFPCLRLAIEAGKTGGTALAVLNAANEIAVNLFLQNRIGFDRIFRLIEEQLEEHTVGLADSPDIIREVDNSIRARMMRDFPAS